MDKKGLMEKILEQYMEQKSNYWIFFGWNDDSDDNNDQKCSRCSACSATYNI